VIDAGRQRQRGFLLIGVVLVLGVLAAIALALSSSTGLELSRASRQGDDAVLDYLAESGLAHAAWQLSRDGSCADYRATPATTLGGGSYGVTVSPTSGSPVTLASVATLAPGGGVERTRLRDDVTVYGSATQKFVLQPDTGGFDTYLWDGPNDTSNFGKAVVLEVKNIGAGRVTLIRFDLSALPEGAVLAGATLQLYLEQAPSIDDGVIDVHAMTRAWIEGEEDGAAPNPAGATYLSYDGVNAWSMPGGDYDPTPVDSVTMLGLGAGWLQWDVTPLAAGGPDSTLATYGFMLRGSGGDLDRVYFTSSDGAAAQRPKLTLSLRCECGSPCSAAADTSSLTLSTRNDAELGGLAFQGNDAVTYDSATDSASLYLDGGSMGHAAGIDALHVLANGHVILSTDSDATIGGLTFNKEDLIDYDPVADTATVFLEAAAHFVTPKNIDAVHVLADGDVVLSTDSPGAVGGVSFSEKDLVLYDMASGVASVLFDGDATTLSATLTGVHVLDSGLLALTAGGTTTLGGLTFGADQVVIYDPVDDEAALLFDGSSRFAATAELASLHVGPVSGGVTGPVAHWRLDEPSGSTAVDSVGGHDATLSGVTARTIGMDGGAVSFDGGSATAAVPDDAFWDLAPAMRRTWTMWVKPDDPSTSWQSLWAQTSTTPRGFGIFAHSTTDANMGPVSNGISVGWDESGSDKLGVHSLDNVLTAGAWHHVAVTYDGDQPQADRVRIYVDGADATDTGDVNSIGTLSGLDPTSIAFGGNPVDVPSWYDGDLDDVRVYDRVLGASAVATIMADTGGGGGPGAIEYRDEFNAPSTFAGTEGTLTWSTPWLDTSENDGPDNGDIIIATDATPYQLRIRDNDAVIERGADLSACSGAHLSFDYRLAELDKADDTLAIEVSPDGGASWIQLDLFVGPASETVYQSASYDIGSYLASDTRIRFVTSPKLRNTDVIFVDNVQIDCP